MEVRAGRRTVAHQLSCPIGDLLGSDRESLYLEYKSTLRWDINLQRKNRDLEDAVVKAIAGFANSPCGGTLLIGVADDGSIHGLEDDYATFSQRVHRGDRDLWGQHLQNLVRTRLGDATFTLVTWQFHKVDDKDIARIGIGPSDVAVFFRRGGTEAFWWRTPVGTISVTDRAERDLIIERRFRTSGSEQNVPPPLLEGSAISGAARDLSRDQRLRYALVAPRLVAPHRYAGYEGGIDAIEAVALLAQGRFRDLNQFAEQHPDVPDPQSPAANREWTWRFVAAIWDWVRTDSVEQLSAALASAVDGSAAAASGVLLACALRRLERYDTAAVVLEELVERDDLGRIDRGWVLVQRARVRAESGDIAGVRSDAADAQSSIVDDGNDITVSVLAGAAAWLLYATAENAEGNLRGMVTASDTVVSWWRSRTIAEAFQRSAETWFRSWAEEDQAQVGFIQDWAALDLFAAELSADVTGEHRIWRTISALGACHRLIRAAASQDESRQLVKGLDALRRSGDSQSLKLAISHLLRVGPIESVAMAVNNIPLDGWTYTTSLANLKALASAGDLVVEQKATDLVFSIAQIAGDGRADFIELVRGTFHVPAFAFGAIAGFLHVARGSAHREVARLIVRKPDMLRDIPPLDLQRLVGRLEYDQVEASDRVSLWELGRQDGSRLGSTILGWLAASGNSDARAELITRAGTGDSYAVVAAIGDLTSLDNSDAEVLIAQLEVMVKKTVADAHNRLYSASGILAGEPLTLLNLRFPDQARWVEIINLLRDPLVAAHEKRYTCLQLTERPGRLPPTVRTELVASIDAVTQTATPGFLLDTEIGGMGVLLAIAVGALRGDEANAAATELAYGSSQERQDLASLLGMGHCRDIQPLLAALVGDPQFAVRRAVADAVGRLATTRPDEPIHALARKLAHDDGSVIPSVLLGGMSRTGLPLPTRSQQIAQHLRQHASARVRHMASHLLE